MTDMGFCTGCGRQAAVGDQFCAGCGKSVGDQFVPETVAPKFSQTVVPAMAVKWSTKAAPGQPQEIVDLIANRSEPWWFIEPMFVWQDHLEYSRTIWSTGRWAKPYIEYNLTGQPVLYVFPRTITGAATRKCLPVTADPSQLEGLQVLATWLGGDSTPRAYQPPKGSATIVCPHCGKRGGVTTRTVKQKQGISGGKATGALLTGGASLLATGLSRKVDATQMHCSNCKMTWTA